MITLHQRRRTLWRLHSYLEDIAFCTIEPSKLLLSGDLKSVLLRPCADLVEDGRESLIAFLLVTMLSGNIIVHLPFENARARGSQVVDKQTSGSKVPSRPASLAKRSLNATLVLPSLSLSGR
nr:hypothetical protein CFP56_30995 [Quercus suber]